MAAQGGREQASGENLTAVSDPVHASFWETKSRDMIITKSGVSTDIPVYTTLGGPQIKTHHNA